LTTHSQKLIEIWASNFCITYIQS